MMNENKCPLCKTPHQTNAIKCSFCHINLKDDEKSQAKYIGQQIAKKAKIKEAYKGVRIAYNLMSILAVFDFAIAGIIYIFIQRLDPVLHGFTIGFGLMLLTFAKFIHKNPILFISLPIGILSFLYLIYYTITPNFYLSILYVRLGLIFTLSYCLYLVRRSKKISLESPYLKDGIWEDLKSNDLNIIDT